MAKKPKTLKYLCHPHRDRTHVDWVKAYLSVWTELQGYIKQHHTTGLTWSKSVSPSSGFSFV